MKKIHILEKHCFICVLVFNNSLVIQWIASSGQTPKDIILPYGKHPLSVVGNSTDHNDGYVNVVSCYNLTDVGFSYIVGNNSGNYCTELCYFLVVC